MRFFLNEIDRWLWRVRDVELRRWARQGLIRCLGNRARPVLMRVLRMVLRRMRMRIRAPLGMRVTMPRMMRTRMRMSLRRRHHRGPWTAAAAGYHCRG